MSWRLKFPQALDVILRIPPVFIIDSNLNGTFLLQWLHFDASELSLATVAWIILCFLSVLGSLVLLVLPRQLLFDAYNMLLSLGILGASFWYNRQFVNRIKEIPEGSVPIKHNWQWESNTHIVLINIILQVVLGYCYNNLTVDYNRNWLGSAFIYGRLYTGWLTYLLFLQCTICGLLNMPTSILTITPYLSIVLLKSIEAKLITQRSLRETILHVKILYLNLVNLIRVLGVPMFIETHWVNLRVPVVLRVFWIMRTAYQLVYLYIQKLQEDHDVTFQLSQHKWWETCQLLLISGCETLTALLGMTSIVSLITHHLGLIFAYFLQHDEEDDRNMGTLAAVLFFILALQTGLTGLSPEKRLVRLYRNFCLLSTAILHFIHGMVHPQLMNLSAAQSMSIMKHIRALIVCIILVFFPIGLLYYLWSEHSLSTWLLAVTAFSIEVIIKVVISLLVYTLFMLDAYQNTFWEKLDDYVYYIKSVGSSIEFLFGIFLFCNGAWIMVFESGGMIRAFMMGIHAYFNIWVQAKEGWKVFMKRRTAVNKINSLPEASAAQLSEHNDVCAICYQELQNARITNCNHMFHGVCLRKWLYVQDNCPLCHEPIYASNSDPMSEEADAPAAGNGLLIHPHED